MDEQSVEAPAAGTAETRPAVWPRVERRSGWDRRLRYTRWYDRVFGHRRRQRGRRRGESRNRYFDVYYASDLLLVGTIFVLNLLDAVLTLGFLERGGVEQNPLIERLIEAGPGYFLLEKIFVVGLCLAAIVVHQAFWVARVGAYGLLVAYGLLTLHHLRLWL
jgi:Domain of unknown function (DUF5658)